LKTFTQGKLLLSKYCFAFQCRW